MFIYLFIFPSLFFCFGARFTSVYSLWFSLVLGFVCCLNYTLSIVFLFAFIGCFMYVQYTLCMTVHLFLLWMYYSQCIWLLLWWIFERYFGAIYLCSLWNQAQSTCFNSCYQTPFITFKLTDQMVSHFFWRNVMSWKSVSVLIESHHFLWFSQNRTLPFRQLFTTLFNL